MSMTERRPRAWPWRIGIRTLLIFGIGGVTMAAVAGAALTGLINARENTRDLLRDKALAIIDAKNRRVDGQLRPIQRTAAAFSDAIANHRIELGNTVQLAAYLEGMLSAAPQISAVAIIEDDGRPRRFAREERRLSIENRVDRSAIRRAFSTGDALQWPTWGELIRPLPLGDTVINMRVPLRVDGRYVGLAIMAVAVSTSWNCWSRRTATGHWPSIPWSKSIRKPIGPPSISTPS
jgi:adenylate cyclase